jgi:hypothetical protein
VAATEAGALNGLFKWSPKGSDPPVPAPPLSTDVVTASKVLPRFLSALVQQPAPVLLDLGPIVGPNIAFFGDRLACKIYVEDFVSDIEAHTQRGDRDAVGAALTGRLTQEPDSVDGILCWDLFDFLERASGLLLASRLTKLLRRGGVLYGFFGTTAVDMRSYSRFIVESEDTLRIRTLPATPVSRTVLQPRDLLKMFDPLLVSESVLLKSSTRETLLRKP